MSVKLKDIAERANVSISTVSRVINNEGGSPASKETTDKIWAIVKELGYVPNQSARNLIKGKEQEAIKQEKSIGCIYTSTLDTCNDPFFSRIGRGVRSELKRRGYSMVYALSIVDMEFSEIYNFVMDHPVEGVVVTGRFDEATLDFLQSNFDNVIYAGVNYIDGGFDEVICDGYLGAKKAMKHLIEKGHRKIGFVGYIPERVEKDAIVNEHRFEAYKDVLREYDMKLIQEDILHTKLRADKAYSGMLDYLKGKVLEELPTAFYCANDVTAIGVMKAIRETGFSIPGDIAVVGLDDVDMASYVTPPLTTVKIQKEELGRTAAKILVDKIESGRDYPLRVDLPVELVIREST